MKPILSIAAIAGVVITLTANAQYQYTASTNTYASKKIANTHRGSDTLAFTKFHSRFANVRNDVWEAMPGGYVVRFTTKDDIQNWVYLTKKGAVIGQMRYYKEAQLPTDVRNQVRSSYYDFAITSAKEITHKGATAYLVTVEDATSWKVIHVVDRDMEVYEEHAK